MLGMAGAAAEDVERMPLLGPGPDRPGDLQRVLGPPCGVASPPGQHQPLGMSGQHAGPLGGGLGWQDPHRLLQGGQAGRLVTGHPALRSHPHVQQRHPRGVVRLLELAERLGEQRERTPGVTQDPGHAGRPGEQLDMIQSDQQTWLRHQPPQLKGSLVVVVGLCEAAEVLCGLPGPDPGRQRVSRLLSRVPVGGQLSGCRHAVGEFGPLRERGGAGGVQAGPLTGKQAAIYRLLQQRVAKPVAVLSGPDHQQLGGDRCPKRPRQLPVIQVSHGGQQPVGRAPAGHRRRPEHVLGRF
jgi:hypothetical protein